MIGLNRKSPLSTTTFSICLAWEAESRTVSSWTEGLCALQPAAKRRSPGSLSWSELSDWASAPVLPFIWSCLGCSPAGRSEVGSGRSMRGSWPWDCSYPGKAVSPVPVLFLNLAEWEREVIPPPANNTSPVPFSSKLTPFFNSLESDYDFTG